MVAVAVGIAPAGAGRAQDLRPNVVVILTDDQTAESLRVMANVKALLVRQGVRFERSYASYPLCCPSRATLLTGQYAHNHRVLGNVAPLGGHEALRHANTLSVWLQRAGYHTAFVGKFLNGYGDRNRYEVPPGWSDWRAMLRKPGSQSQLYHGFTLNENAVLVDYPKTPSVYLTDVLTTHAKDAIAVGASSGTPFFLLLSYFAPHSGRPLDPDDVQAPGVTLNPKPAVRHRDVFAGEPFLPPPSFDEKDVSDKPPSVRRRPRLSVPQVQAIQEAYEQRLESLLAVDEGVAQVIDALRMTEELENTLVVFTSDNGYMLGEHRIPPDRGKGSVYEPSVRVPLVMQGLDLPRGRRVTKLVSNVDLASTILEATKAAPGRVQDGISLLPVARGISGPLRRDLLLESSTYAAIRTDRHVYVSYKSGEKELYDLRLDRHQLRNRVADPALAEVRADLAQRLRQLRACAGAACRQRPR
jgi:arylsulfatase A-like enzyme